MARRNLIRHNPKRASYFAKNSGRILDWVIKDMSPEWMAENAHVMSCPPKPNVLYGSIRMEILLRNHHLP